MNRASSGAVERTIVAFNYATDSDNRIHANDVAQQFGFRGGLVPGVGDYGYLARTVEQALGAEWLASGWMEAKFVKPVYDGDTVTARVSPANVSDHLLNLELIDSAGTLCAVGRAGDAQASPFAESDWFEPNHLKEAAPPSMEQRIPARLAHLSAGTQFGSLHYDSLATEAWHADSFGRFVEDATLGEADPEPTIGRASSSELLHPAFIPEMGNEILMRNTVLGPWIHTASRVRHLHPLQAGDRLTIRGRVANCQERKSREIVVLEVGVYAGDRCCAQLIHTAIVYLGSVIS